RQAGDDRARAAREADQRVPFRQSEGDDESVHDGAGRRHRRVGGRRGLHVGSEAMSLLRQPSRDPLWRDEFSVHAEDEQYVTRRQFAKFLTLTSFAMAAGNGWILARSWMRRAPAYPTLS